MRKKKTMILSAGAIASALTLSLTVLIWPMFAQSNTHSRVDPRRFSEFARIKQEIDSGDLANGEADVRSYMAAYPRAPWGSLMLADVRYRQGRLTDAYPLYRKVIAPSLGNYGDTESLFQYADSATAAGHPSEAAAAYRRATKDIRGFFDRVVFGRIDSGAVGLQEMKIISAALVAGVEMRPGYIRQVQQAIQSAPQEPSLRYLYALILRNYRKLRDANAALDETAALLPIQVRREFKAKAYVQFGLDRWDHGSKGVVDRDGHVTITQFPMPLPNSPGPLIERRAQVPDSGAP